MKDITSITTATFWKLEFQYFRKQYICFVFVLLYEADDDDDDDDDDDVDEAGKNEKYKCQK